MRQPLWVELLLGGYARGLFPMGDPETGDIYWYRPNPRAILPLESLHVPKRLERTIRRQPFDLCFDTDFRGVIEACAESRPDRPTTWLIPELKEAYVELHRAGYAHSLEAWQDGQLVGGIYGVRLKGLFAGESMFHRVTDASKVCLVQLARHLRDSGFVLFDVQYQTEHLRQFGVMEISAAAYERRLATALAVDPKFQPNA